MLINWSKFLVPKNQKQETMETVCEEGEGEDDDDDDDADDDDPAPPKAKKDLTSLSSSDLFSSSNSSPSVASLNCPAFSNSIGHHQNKVADISQKHQETGRQKQKMGSLMVEKRQKHKQRKWPPWKDELGDKDSLDGMLGCEDCLDKSVHPQLAWNAFYMDENSLRDSFCIGRRCKWAVLDKEDTERSENVLEKSVEAGDDLNKNSSVEGCPLLPADVLPPSPCLSPGWGAHLPSSIQQGPLPLLLQPKQNREVWRPWETGYGGSAGKTRGVVRSEVGEDLNYSLECPSLLPAFVLPSPFSTPVNPSLSAPFFPSPPQRSILIAKKRKRSVGELVRRRQRHLSYQLSQTPPTTPCLEPEQSTLESGDFGVNRNISLDSFPSGDWSSSWLTPSRCMPTPSPFLPTPSSYLPSPSPCPFPPTPWMSNNMAPPSPVYCDGCQKWGNLLTVTISQSRAP